MTDEVSCSNCFSSELLRLFLLNEQQVVPHVLSEAFLSVHLSVLLNHLHALTDAAVEHHVVELVTRGAQLMTQTQRRAVTCRCAQTDSCHDSVCVCECSPAARLGPVARDPDGCWNLLWRSSDAGTAACPENTTSAIKMISEHKTWSGLITS